MQSTSSPTAVASVSNTGPLPGLPAVVGVLRRWYAKQSPQQQIWINAALLVPTFLLYLISDYIVWPQVTLEGWRLANEIQTIIRGLYFVAVVAMVSRDRSRLPKSLTAAGIVVGLDIVASWPDYPTTETAYPTHAAPFWLFSFICLGYVATWGIARRVEQRWMWGLLVAGVVGTFFRAMIEVSPFYGPFPAWIGSVLIFVLGCLICWAIDLA